MPPSPTNYHPVLDALGRAFQWLLWALMFLAFCLVVLWCGKIAHGTILPDGSKPLAFYYWLAVPTCMCALAVSLIGGRTLMRIVNMSSPENLRIFRWFHPAAAARDALVIGFLFGILYFMVVFGLNRWFPGTVVSRVGEMDERWWKYRASLLAVGTALAIFALDRTKRISQGTVVPRGPLAWIAFPLYGAGVVATIYALKDWFSVRFSASVDASLLLFPNVLFVAFGLFEIGLLIAIKLQSDGIPRGKFPIKAQLAIVGPFEVGKTFFFVQAYNALQAAVDLGIRLDPSNTADTAFIVEAGEKAKKGIIPNASALDPKLLNLDLKHYGRTIAQYSWLDLSGETFNPKSPDAFKARATFDAYLPASNGMLLALSAHGKALEENNTDIYTGRIDAYIRGHVEAGEADVPMTIAIVITQYRRAGAKPRVALAKARELAHYARECAQTHECGRVAVRIFKTDAWTNPGADNKPNGAALQSWRVKSPILWLVARTARAQQTAMELAQSTLVGGASKAAETIAVLEQLSREAQ